MLRCSLVVAVLVGHASASPCGDETEADTSYVCSTDRVEPTQQLAVYRDFIALPARDGKSLGLRPITTLSTYHRRDGLELTLGYVVDRIAQLRLSGGPVRAVRDGMSDWGAEIDVGFARMYSRVHIGGQIGSVLGVTYEKSPIALGAALFGGYEVMSTDAVAITIGARAGAEIFNARGDEGSRTAYYVSLSVGIDLYSTYR